MKRVIFHLLFISYNSGARYGPSLMPGGSPDAWPHLKDIFQSICAKAIDGLPCCDWVGEAGSGHFVKMVHNGIEYGDMQLISEAYHLMLALGLGYDQMADVNIISSFLLSFRSLMNGIKASWTLS